MRIVFFGTGKYGVPTLKKILKIKKFEVVAVVTQPDKKRGRGWNVLPSPVKAFIEKASPQVHVFQSEDLKDPAFIENIRKLNADVFIVIDYGKKLPDEVLKIPSEMCINLHPSLLPKYRGAAPVSRAILNGEEKTGNTVFRMSGNMDSGEIIAQEELPIKKNQSAPEILDKLASHGTDLVIRALEDIMTGNIMLEEQNEERATYARKLEKEDGRIDWSDQADGILRKILALQPWPGAFTTLNGKRLKIFKAHVVLDREKEAAFGEVTDNRNFIVKTGKNSLQIDVLQMEGKKKMSQEEFLKGHQLKEKTSLGEDEKN